MKFSERFYQTAFISALASSLISPFIPLYALSIGASRTIIGLISAFTSLSSLSFQLIWAALTETQRRKNLLVALGYLFWSLFWIPISHAKSPLIFLVLLSIQAAFSAMIVPAWQSLLVLLVPKYKRGYVNSRITLFSSLGGFIGSLLGGYLIRTYGFEKGVFYLISLIGVLASLPFVVRYKEKFQIFGRSFLRSLKALIDVKEISKNSNFLYLVKCMIIFNFASSIAGPMFSVYIIQNLKGGSTSLAVLSAISAATILMFYKPWGILVDYIGRKNVIVGSLLPIAFFPLVYYFSDSLIWLYIYQIVGSMSWAGFNIAIFSYLSDLVPKEYSATYLSLYNFFVGISGVTASAFSGVISDHFGIKYVFLLSFLLRTLSLKFFYDLENKRGSRPSGILGLNLIESVSYQIESTVFVYSEVFKEAKRNTVENFLRRMFRPLSF